MLQKVFSGKLIPTSMIIGWTPAPTQGQTRQIRSTRNIEGARPSVSIPVAECKLMVARF